VLQCSRSYHTVAVEQEAQTYVCTKLSCVGNDFQSAVQLPRRLGVCRRQPSQGLSTTQPLPSQQLQEIVYKMTTHVRCLLLAGVITRRRAMPAAAAEGTGPDHHQQPHPHPQRSHHSHFSSVAFTAESPLCMACFQHCAATQLLAATGGCMLVCVVGSLRLHMGLLAAQAAPVHGLLTAQAQQPSCCQPQAEDQHPNNAASAGAGYTRHAASSNWRHLLAHNSAYGCKQGIADQER
jgi:hypothetical protein